jgi:CRISPR-associated protein Csd1
MILQALYDYYQRKSADPDAHMAPPGFEWKEIPFVIEIDAQGNPVQIEDTREGDGKRRRARAVLVPQGGKKSSNVEANLLWGNAEYVLGIPDQKKLADRKSKGKETEYRDRLKDMHAAFASEVKGLSERLHDDPGTCAVLKFCEHPPFEELEKYGEIWEQIKTTNPNLTFRLHGQLDLVCQQRAVVTAINGFTESGNANGMCLITGQPDEIERTHSAIMGVKDKPGAPAQKNIVSVNDGESPAFRSFNKSQGYNSPVGKRAAFGYTTALNHLLRRDSPQRLQVGDATTVFWADKPAELETGVVDIFGEPPKDDPDRNVRAVASLYKAIAQGLLENDEGRAKFFALGLAPNAARIAIRFWHHGTVAEMAVRIRQHFDDLAIERSPRDPPYLSLFRLLVSVATLGKADNIPPNLSGELMRSILADLPYPQTLLAAVVRRIRAEQAKKDDRTGKPIPNVSYPRAALLKACINRATRYGNPEMKEELKVSLDESNPNTGYRLGRLFAVLEKIQEEANPGINATIRDRYYGAASSTPVTVFSTLLKLKNHHLSKLDNRGRAVNLEKRIGEIMDGLGDFPAQLPLADQGRFAIGYYHQRQDFFKKSNTSSEE